jgi:phosphoribosylformylglycinamidine synthase
MAPTKEESENLDLRKGVEALSKICVDLNISVPVGKDSLSMKTKWSEDGNEKGRNKSFIRSYYCYGTS